VRIRAFQVVLGAGAVAASIVAAVPGTPLGNAVLYAGSALVLGGAWWAAFRQPAGQRTPWILLALSLTSTGAANILANLLKRADGSLPDVTAAHVLWLAAYPLLCVSLFLMVRLRAAGQLRAGVLDSAVLSTAAAVTAWQLLIAPAMATGGVTAGTLMYAAMPLGDVLVLAALLVLVLCPGPRSGATALAIGAAVLTLVGDVLYNVLPAVTSTGNVSRVDGLMLLGGALVVAAMLHPRVRELVTPVPLRVRTLHPARVLLLGAALLTAPASAVLHSDATGAGRVILLAATAVASAFILIRFTVAVREQESAQRQLAYQASHDPLTGLVNRATFAELVAANLPAAPVVLYIDLDGFKAVNDTAGHHAGDAILVTVAGRLQRIMRGADVVARLGGDEFAVLCPGLTTGEAVSVAERVIAAVAEPVEYDGAHHMVGASVGIAVADPGHDTDAALRSADAAMYESKRLGRGRWTLAA